MYMKWYVSVSPSIASACCLPNESGNQNIFVLFPKCSSKYFWPKSICRHSDSPEGMFVSTYKASQHFGRDVKQLRSHTVFHPALWCHSKKTVNRVWSNGNARLLTPPMISHRPAFSCFLILWKRGGYSSWSHWYCCTCYHNKRSSVRHTHIHTKGLSYPIYHLWSSKDITWIAIDQI